MPNDRATATQHTALFGTPIFKVKGKARKQGVEPNGVCFSDTNALSVVKSPTQKEAQTREAKTLLYFVPRPTGKGEWLFVVDSHEHYVVWHVTLHSQG